MDIIYGHAATNAVLGILAAILVGWVIDKAVTWLESRATRDDQTGSGSTGR